MRGGPTDPQPPVVDAYLPARVRLLNRLEFNNTVSTLLGDSSRPADAFPLDATQSGFTNDADHDMGALLASDIFAASEVLAGRAVGDLVGVSKCDPSVRGEKTCARRFIDTFARKAFRRPLTKDDRSDLMEVFNATRAGSDFATGIRFVVETILNSGSFLYATELGDPDGADTGDPRLLTPHETAAQLSYLLTAAPPDDELTALADAGTLADDAIVKAQTARLLADPRGHAQVQRFYFEWLEISALPSTLKDLPFTTFNALKPSMSRESAAFVDDLVYNGDGSVRALLNSSSTFVDQQLAQFYGLGISVPEGALLRASLVGTPRRGILTQSAFLSVHAHLNTTSPIQRGVFVRRRLLCDDLPAPPANVVAMSPPPPILNATTRQMFDAHTSAPQCSGCHLLINPVGDAFEHFDAIGGYRATEVGQAIDSAGRITGSQDADGTFADAAGLVQLLASSDQVRRCFQRHFFRFASAQNDPAAEGTFMSSLPGRPSEGFLDLLNTYVTSRLFQLRVARP